MHLLLTLLLAVTAFNAGWHLNARRERIRHRYPARRP